MRYPSINEYLTALRSANDFSRSLADVELCGDSMGELFYSGNNGVVFVARQGGKTIALKCFTRPQQGRQSAYSRLVGELPQSPHLMSLELLVDELSVATRGKTALHDIVKMDYIEGRPLSVAIEESIRKGDRRALGQINIEFNRLSLWLL